MEFSYKVVTEPTSEPVSLAEAKAQCRIEDDFTEDNAWLTQGIIVARQVFEGITGLALIDQTIELVLSGFPSDRMIELPRPPLLSVTSVEYYDEDEASRNFAASNYITDDYDEPGAIELKPASSWPSTFDRFDAVKITYQAGYANAAAVKAKRATAYQAILMLVADLYSKREYTTEAGMKSAVERSAQNLINLNKSYAWV